jgi:hypothetical protein
LPDYSKITFPETDPIPLEDLVPEASEDAVDLFKQFVKYNAEERSTAEAALLHRYFFTKPMAARMEAMPTAAHSGKEADHQINCILISMHLGVEGIMRPPKEKLKKILSINIR